MGVMVTAECAPTFSRGRPRWISPSTCNVEMIADVVESPVEDVVQSAGFRRKGFPLWRGTAMNDNQSDGTHKSTYSSVLLSDHLR